MKAVTIDNFDIKIHEQYARDRVSFDPTFIVDAQGLSPHFEIGGTSSIYSSKWEELFEIGARNAPWAMFAAPLSFKFNSNRYFRFSILPTFDEFLEDEEDEDHNDEESEAKNQLRYKILSAKKGKKQTHEIFENERSKLLNFCDSVKILNKLLTHINSRKLQYQKG